MSGDHDLDRELQFHLDERVADLVSRGKDRDEAVRIARAELGGLTQIREAIHDQDRWRLLNGLGQDLRLAVRTLRATPLVTLIAVLSLALGIGANTAIFSIVDSLVTRSLPLADPQQLTVVTGGIPTFPFVSQLPGYTFPIWQAIAERSAAFGASCAWSPMRIDLAHGGELQPAEGILVSGNFFGALGVPAFLGRTLDPDDDKPDGGRSGVVAVVSYAFWQRRLGGRPDVVGQPLLIERVPFTIVGVTPRGFSGVEVGRDFDVALPIASAPMIGRASMLKAWVFRILIRLRPAESIETATAALRALQPQIREAAPADASAQLDILKSPLTLLPAAAGTSLLRQRYAGALLVLTGVVGLILLVACANVANLLLARAAARRQQFSLQLALGASRWRIARQLLVESVVLSTAGTVAGAVLAAWGVHAVVTQLSTPVTRVFLDVSPDWGVAGFTAAVALGTALLFGTLPSLRASREAPADALRRFGRGGTGEPRADWTGRLVVIQIALSLVLVAASGLFLRSFVRLTTTPIGFDADRVLLVNVNASRAHIAAPDRLPTFLELMQKVRRLPGVSGVGASTLTPAGGISVVSFVNVSGLPVSVDSEHAAATNVVTQGWLATYGLRLLAGRDFDGRDVRGRAPVAIVNESFARKFFRAGQAVGRSYVGLDGTTTTIVGVASDAVYNSIKEAIAPAIYLPLPEGQNAPATLNISVRVATGRPNRLARSVAAAISETNPDLTFSFRELAEQMDASIAQDRLLAILSSFFGALALILAGIGVYGVTAYAVARHRTDIAIRMAIGATPYCAIGPLVASLVTRIGLGSIVGLVMTLCVSRFTATLLYGVGTHDCLALSGAALALVIVALPAGLAPAYRASRIDPARVLGDI